MKYRQHKGSLEESIATTCEIDATKHAIASLASNEIGRNVDPASISVTHYGYDSRISWDSYIVEVEGYGVLGFTDGCVE